MGHLTTFGWCTNRPYDPELYGKQELIRRSERKRHRRQLIVLTLVGWRDLVCVCSVSLHHLHGIYTQKSLAFLVVGWNAASFMELPWALARSATHLFKQAICTAYAGHKPLTVSGEVNVCSACLWIFCTLFVCLFIVFCSLFICVYLICVYLVCVTMRVWPYQSQPCTRCAHVPKVAMRPIGMAHRLRAIDLDAPFPCQGILHYAMSVQLVCMILHHAMCIGLNLCIPGVLRVLAAVVFMMLYTGTGLIIRSGCSAFAKREGGKWP